MRTKKLLEIYKSVYVGSLLLCVCVLFISIINDPMPYVIANMLELVNFDVLNALKGGSNLDPVDFANFKIL